ncbi:polyprenyl synthetase family protein [Saccharicrinis sp. FJH54]|uniref:polyprenyl synthetase family protein n=1 Tax=Saccharicrinis sp. FJH54 TaxID=3344665 RepID=UPI0035D45E89
MDQLEKIKQPIQKDLDAFSEFYKDILQDNYKRIQAINKYILKQKGKLMRPTLVFLAARLFDEPNINTTRAAASLEMLHNASLIHDDVIDETHERRGLLSINAIWNNKNAILMGDYLLSTSLTLSVDTHNYDFLYIMSDLSKTLSKGEILQMEKTKTLDITEEEYYDIIRMKTAILFSSCAKAGAISVNASKEDIKKIEDIGMALGVAFQIRDDIFDYQTKGIIGKPIGNDLKEKKITLPLIYALNKANDHTKKRIIKSIKRYNNSTRKMKEVTRFAVLEGGIEYAENAIEKEIGKAHSILDTYPDSEIKTALKDFIDFTVNRVK